MVSSSVPHCIGIAYRTHVVAVSMAYMICLRMYLGSNKEHLMAYYLQHSTDAGSAGTVRKKGYLSRWQMADALYARNTEYNQQPHSAWLWCVMQQV